MQGELCGTLCKAQNIPAVTVPTLCISPSMHFMPLFSVGTICWFLMLCLVPYRQKIFMQFYFVNYLFKTRVHRTTLSLQNQFFSEIKLCSSNILFASRRLFICINTSIESKKLLNSSDWIIVIFWKFQLLFCACVVSFRTNNALVL